MEPYIKTNYTLNNIDFGRLFEPIYNASIKDKNNTELIPFTAVDASFAYYEFNESDTLTFTNCVGMQFSCLAVGGGGGSGQRTITAGAGGAGGGGMVAGSFTLNSGIVTINVGAGGTGGNDSNGIVGTVGSSSTVFAPNFSITGGGGGRGGGSILGTPALAGIATNGCGGGAGGVSSNTGRTGHGIGWYGGNSSLIGGGGGGGMGSPGLVSTLDGGEGGIGASPSIVGFGLTYYSNTLFSYGGKGSYKQDGSYPLPNTRIEPGSGAAGGDTSQGQHGATGIVIIAYAL